MRLCHCLLTVVRMASFIVCRKGVLRLSLLHPCALKVERVDRWSMVKATLECPAAVLTLFRSAPESMERVTNELELILGRCGPLRIWRLGLDLNWYRPRGR